MNLKTLAAQVALGALAMTTTLAWSAPLEIAGSTTVQKSIVEPVASKARDAVGLELKMLPVGTGKGMQMLFDGKVSVAAISDELADAVAAAKKVGATNAPANLKMVTVLKDSLVPILHPDNTVAALSKDQLRGILSGKVTNWKDVGGADLPILVVIPAAGSATRGVIEKQVLAGAAFASTAKELRTSSAEIAEVAREKGAIGYVGAGVAEGSKGKVREAKGPDVSRPLAFVTVGDPSPEVKKLYDFLQTAEAKKLFLE
jgi:phosphate transport system substrate-binding protein